MGPQTHQFTSYLCQSTDSAVRGKSSPSRFRSRYVKKGIPSRNNTRKRKMAALCLDCQMQNSKTWENSKELLYALSRGSVSHELLNSLKLSRGVYITCDNSLSPIIDYQQAYCSSYISYGTSWEKVLKHQEFYYCLIK